MRILAAAGFLVLAFAVPSLAQPVSPPPKPPRVCLHPFDSPIDAIDHTQVVDPQTILFYMRGGKIWKNTLHGACPGLRFNGFTFVTSQDEICANEQAIKVIQTGEVCVLGDFTPYTPPPPAPH
jgi:hypothetical protein